MSLDQSQLDPELTRLDQRLRALSEAGAGDDARARVWNRLTVRMAQPSSAAARPPMPALLGFATVLVAAGAVVLVTIGVRAGFLHLGPNQPARGAVISAQVSLRSMPAGTIVLDWDPNARAATVATKISGLRPNSSPSLVLYRGDCSNPGATAAVLTGTVGPTGGLSLDPNALASLGAGVTSIGSVVIQDPADPGASVCAGFGQPHLVGSGTQETSALLPDGGGHNAGTAAVSLMSDGTLSMTLAGSHLQSGVRYAAEVHAGNCPAAGALVGRPTAFSLSGTGATAIVSWPRAAGFASALRSGSYLGLYEGPRLVACGDIVVAGSTPSPSVGPAVAGWTQAQPAASPGARAGAAMSYDAATKQVILFGGSVVCPSCPSGPAVLGDVWAWNGTGWSRLDASRAPGPRRDAAMAYDAAQGVVVLFGGSNEREALGDTWIWNGATWIQQHPAAAPPPRIGASMAWDAARGRLILFGGFTTSSGGGSALDDTWAWSGTTWSRLAPSTGPPARSGAMLAYDAARSVLVLFGGSSSAANFLDDTWTWDGSSWTRQQPAVHPPAKADGAIAYDPESKAIILFGGNGCTMGCVGLDAEVWSWDGMNWTRLSPLTSPPPRFGASLAYDDARHDLVMFGGQTADRAYADTWTWPR